MTQPTYELAIERHIAAPPETVWRIWTDRLEEWWCPKPWTTKLIELDLRPGGRCAMIMSGPNGESHPQDGVVLEVVPNRRIVFTDAFTVGWIPHAPFMVGFFELTPKDGGTHYRAGSRHWTEADHKKHEAMGFHAGWSKVADQLAALAEGEG